MAAGSAEKRIYVLELERGRFYIGSSRNVDRRFAEHLSGRGAAWTSSYGPLRVVETRSVKTPFDEDNVTKQYMAKHGISRVRGGSYSSVELSPAQITVLRRELAASKEACFNCGRTGHLSSFCPAPKKRASCSRCGRTSHTASDCYARTTVDGSFIADKTQSSTCYRCGREGHFASECYARTTADGHRLGESRREVPEEESEDEESEESDDEDTCSRCGRSGHTVDRCYAKSTIGGKYLGRKKW